MKINSKFISFIGLIIVLDYGQELLAVKQKSVYCVSGTEEFQLYKTFSFFIDRSSQKNLPDVTL